MSLFGTDGIRGKTNIEPMTVETILRVAKAAGYVLSKTSSGRKNRVLIGKDTRLSGYMFETALESGFCSMGVDVFLVGPIPTPAIAYLTESMRADLGMMISASHNPYEDNGIKFFDRDGFKISDQMEEEISRLVVTPDEVTTHKADPSNIGKATRLDDAIGRYISHLKQYLSKKHTLDGMKIVVDCANGSAYKIAPIIYTELGATVVAVGNQPNGKNINDGCGALYPDLLAKRVVAEKADIGVAFDGDADRVVFSDEHGNLYDGDDYLSILSDNEEIYPEVKKGIVGTVMTNFGLEKKLKEKQIPFFRSDVGDRYVVEMMKRKRVSFGAEASGHIVSLKRSTTGDGILSSILLFNILQKRKQKLSFYRNSFERYPQEIQSIRVKQKTPFEQLPLVLEIIQSAEEKLSGNGRLLVRYSGTECKARIMVESQNSVLVRTITKEISSAIEKAIGVL